MNDCQQLRALSRDKTVNIWDKSGNIWDKSGNLSSLTASPRVNVSTYNIIESVHINIFYDIFMRHHSSRVLEYSLPCKKKKKFLSAYARSSVRASASFVLFV